MNRGFVERLLGEGQTLGEAFLRSHRDERLSNTHRTMYQIQGDPALRLQ